MQVDIFIGLLSHSNWWEKLSLELCSVIKYSYYLNHLILWVFREYNLVHDIIN